MKKQKKKFKDTKVGKFLLGAGSGIVDVVGDLLPNSGIMGVVKNLIDKDPTLPPEDKEKAMKLLELDMIEMNCKLNRKLSKPKELIELECEGE